MKVSGEIRNAITDFLSSGFNGFDNVPLVGYKPFEMYYGYGNEPYMCCYIDRDNERACGFAISAPEGAVYSLHGNMLREAWNKGETDLLLYVKHMEGIKPCFFDQLPEDDTP